MVPRSTHFDRTSGVVTTKYGGPHQPKYRRLDEYPGELGFEDRPEIVADGVSGVCHFLGGHPAIGRQQHSGRVANGAGAERGSN
jgi:hypothetical protein